MQLCGGGAGTALHCASCCGALADDGVAFAQVEEALGGKPVDIEGVVLEDGSVAVVQARPQILPV